MDYSFRGLTVRATLPTKKRFAGPIPMGSRLQAALTETDLSIVIKHNARVKVDIGEPGGPWLRKRSTLYPDSMSRADVVGAILHAYENRAPEASQKFSGPSGKGFTIQGYLLPDGRINTAFPLYKRGE